MRSHVPKDVDPMDLVLVDVINLGRVVYKDDVFLGILKYSLPRRVLGLIEEMDILEAPRYNYNSLLHPFLANDNDWRLDCRDWELKLWYREA